ncbi:MAG: hypothetical protein AABX25_01125, partial [Nanoarchaeota archaeon]
LLSANITYNMSGVITYVNFSLSGTTAQVSNVTKITGVAGDVINFTMYATDTNNNVKQNSTLITIVAGTCTCPASGDWEISDGSICELTTTCDLGANRLRVNNGGLRILGGVLRASGCYIDKSAKFFVDTQGGFACRS